MYYKFAIESIHALGRWPLIVRMGAGSGLRVLRNGATGPSTSVTDGAFRTLLTCLTLMSGLNEEVLADAEAPAHDLTRHDRDPPSHSGSLA